MLPESDNVVASMGWVRVLQNFDEACKTSRSRCELSKKGPSVGSIAGALLVDGRPDIGLALRELPSDARDLMQTQMAA